MKFDFVSTENGAYPIFDTHAHYNDERFDDEIDGGRDEVLAALLSGSVKHIVNAGTNLRSSAECIALAERYPQLYATAGIHPGDINADDDIEQVMDSLRGLLAHPKVRALGEIGLDYHYDYPKDVQQKWLRRQLELAAELDMPVVIHDREAHGDIMDILREYPTVKGEFHSFSASGEIARQLVSRGWYISFSGVITFKNAARLAEIVPTVPLDRVMIETDAPYLAPVPCRGKMNHSGLMEYTAARAAELYGIPVEEFCRHAYENSCQFFGIEE
ncbi:MAG: TatD family hydrolase [Clostridia bacterium]|nr:TatD family hydrolase [Clostridia bacterium]